MPPYGSYTNTAKRPTWVEPAPSADDPPNALSNNPARRASFTMALPPPSQKTMTREEDADEQHASQSSDCCGCMSGGKRGKPGEGDEAGPGSRQDAFEDGLARGDSRATLSGKGRSALKRMSTETTGSMKALLAGHNKEMGRAELREVLGHVHAERCRERCCLYPLFVCQVLGDAVSEELFEFLFHLFDADGARHPPPRPSLLHTPSLHTC